jgi:hypothetical protein
VWLVGHGGPDRLPTALRLSSAAATSVSPRVCSISVKAVSREAFGASRPSKPGRSRSDGPGPDRASIRGAWLGRKCCSTARATC